jgi:myo-inositol-1(or 4)-monophosphatase
MADFPHNPGNSCETRLAMETIPPMIPDPEVLLETCQRVARLGGQELMKYRDSFQTREKAPWDLVTDADLASQQVIHDALQEVCPDHQFLGEEQLSLPMAQNRNSDYTWIVDPLDGTLNYVHGLQSFSVSVALRFRGRILTAAVYDPWLQELYAADERYPATLNGQPIAVSGCADLDKALAVISLPTAVQADSPELADFLKLLFAARSVRRLGSAALNLCYVAAGRLDLYWATTLSCWDVAAGYLILKQAGGVMTGTDGSPFDLDRPRMIAAASESLNRQAVAVLAGGD